MNKDELKMELIYSLPSKRMLEVANNLAIRNPKTNELIFLKQRPNFENTPLLDYIEYSERHDVFHDYKELLAKSVIVNNSLMNDRGKRVLGIL